MLFLFALVIFLVQGEEEACVLGTQTGCSTGIALGLTNQIAAQMTRMGHTFTSLNTTWIQCSNPCVSQLQAKPAAALAQAAAAAKRQIVLNSAFRSSAQQYLLYTWYKKGICGIPLAAMPGKSNHEGGRAIDTSAYQSWVAPLAPHGWVHSMPTSDPVHFDYQAAPDLRAQNLIAFQKLWNQHNPTKKISEDGVYGPATANAFANAPCNGW